MLATATIPKNAYDVALENFDLAANALGLDDGVRAMIKYPERVLSVSVPLKKPLLNESMVTIVRSSVATEGLTKTSPVTAMSPAGQETVLSEFV